MNKKTNLFLIPVFGFIPAKYRKLIAENGGKLFLVVLILCLIRTIIFGIQASVGLTEVFNELPEFSLTDNGGFEIDQTFKVEEDGTYIVIDPTIESIDEKAFKNFVYENNYQNVIIMTHNNVGMLSNNGLNVIDYNKLQLCKLLNVNEINNNTLLDVIKPWILIITAFMFIILIISYYIASLLCWLLALIANAICKTDLTGGEQFKLAVVAKMPVFIIDLLVTVITPYSLPLLVAILLILGFMILGLKMSESDNNMPNNQLYDDYNNSNYNSDNYNDKF